MKFMLSWRIHSEKRTEALKAFAQMTPEHDRADLGDHIKLIGRWHDMGRMQGIAIFESEDAQAIANWALNWNSVLDIEDLTPVLDDEEARAVGRSR
jgi:hypothetical protein